MSIKAKPWKGGTGGATVPDASETTKGKIRIATTTESNAGTDDLTAMTPAKVKARIDAALVGGVEYKGQIAVSAFSTLLNADQGDMYKISTGGTAGDGRTYEAGDTIIVNADMGGTFADSKLDKIDNTEIISSVNGQTGPVNIYADDTVLNIAGTGLSISGSGATSTLNADSATTSAPGIIEIATNAEATAGSATDKALVPSNLASVGTSQLNNDAGFITSVASASESTAGIIEIATNAEATAGSATDKALVPSNLSSVGTSQLNNDAGFITSAGVGNQITTVVRTGSSTSITAVVNALYSIGASSATVTLPSSSLSEGDLVGVGAQGGDKTNTTVSGTISNSNNTDVTSVTFTASRRGVVWFAYDSDSSRWLQLNDPTNFSSSTEAGVIEIATNAEATAGSATDKALVPSNLSSVGTSQLNNDAGFITSVASASESTAGIIEIATNAEATAGSATDKALVPSNLSSVGTSQLNNDAGFITSVASASESTAGIIEIATNAEATAGSATDKALVPSNISSILTSPALTGTPTAPTATSGTNTTQIATTAFVQSAVTSAGGLSAVVDDTTPQLGGNLDVNGQSITSASGGNVVINPDGAGTINLGADTIPDADATHDLGTESARFAEIHGELEGAVMFKARNETGGSLTKGQAVYISGLSGSTPLISLAQSNSASTMQAFGLLAANVSNNADVKVITFGNLTDIDTSSFSAGDTVFISSTVAGGLVSSAPTGTANLIQNIGKVVRSHASAGIIKVGGAGRTNATPNLNNGQVFAGNASNQAVATALSSIAVTSLNGSAGVVTVSGDDLAADHSASNYTAANANIDGHLSGIDTALGTRLSDVVGDTTPQLGGNLDTNGQDIVTTSNADLDLAPDGTGVVVIRGNQTGGNNQGAIKLNCEQNSHGVTIKAPAHSATASYNLILPTGVGTAGQVLRTDGGDSSTPKNVQLSWVTQSGGGGGSVPTVRSASPSTAYTITLYTGIEEIYLLTPSASVVVNIPSASTVGTGYKYQIKNLSASYNLTLTPSSSSIDTQGTFVLDTPNQSVTLVSDGSNYFII